ncbi:aurora kinase A-like isoform X3 [Halichondria panicea]
MTLTVDRTLATNLQEIKRIREEKIQLMAQMEHFRTESYKLQRQLQTAEATYERREAELVQEADALTDEAAKTQDKVQMAAAMNISLNEQLESVTQDRDSKLKNLEILANEKVFVDDQWTREKNHGASLAQDLAAKEQELSHTKQNYDRTATELQDAHQRLEVSVADTERLHNEVMVTMAQVKQHKKQADSFKAEVEEANAILLKTQQELQRCQELIKTMEMDYQDQIEQTKAEAISNKLAIEDMDVYRQMMEEKTHQLATLHQELTSWKASNYQNREKIDYLERTAIDRQSVVSGLASNVRSQKQHIHQLEVEIEHQKETNGRLEARLERQDELAPYCVSQVLYLGQQEGSGSYGSIHSTQLNGINCIAKRVHDIFLGHGNVEQLSLEDKRAAYQKFRRECVLLSRMRHPNIVQFMGVSYGPQRDYGRELTLVMEHLYMNLYDCLHRYPNIEMWLKISILLDVSQGLLHLHSQGIVHRDLTTPNVLLTTSFHAKIADLGVSKIIQVRGTKLTTAPGNPDYMPPEARTEVPTYGYALDIFSFGVIMLFVLTQKYPTPYEVPFTVTGVQRKEIQIQKRMKWISKLSPEDPMRQLICRCLQDDP